MQARSRRGEQSSAAVTSVPASRYVLFSLIAVVGCAADLWTKQAVFDWLGPPNPLKDNTYWIWDGVFGFQTAVNQGALFGMGQGMSGWFATLSIAAAVGIILWLFVFKGARDGRLTIALGCVTAGIFGNLYDRLGLWHSADAPASFQHGVRDWILFQFGDYNWPNFNIADSLLVCGAILLFLHAFKRPAGKKNDPNKLDAPAETTGNSPD